MMLLAIFESLSPKTNRREVFSTLPECYKYRDSILESGEARWDEVYFKVQVIRTGKNLIDTYDSLIIVRM